MALATTTAIAAIGVGASIAGGAVQYQGQRVAAKASRAAEKLRETQMNLEADRERRTTLRQAQVARSVALSNATAQGAGESSGLEGGMAQVAGQMNTNLQSINQSQQIGAGLFKTGAQEARGKSIAAFGGALSQFGDQWNANLPTITRFGNYGMGKFRT